MDLVIKILSSIALVSGIVVGSFMFLKSRKQPDQQRQLRILGTVFFGIAVVMALLLLL